VIFETLVTTHARTEVIDRFSTETAAHTGHRQPTIFDTPTAEAAASMTTP
jgi:hypothetical protein